MNKGFRGTRCEVRGAALLAYIFIACLFIMKYGLRVAGWGPVLTAVLTYGVAVLAAARWLLPRLGRWVSAGRGPLWIAVAVVVVLLVAQAAIDPYALQVDRWSAIHNFLWNLFHGIYPYSAQTHLGGYGSPFPVWQVLHIPFYLLGNVGLSVALGLGLMTHALWLTMGRRTALCAFWLMVAHPAFLYEVMVRSDLLTNFMVSLSAVAYLHHCRVSLRSRWALVGLVGGLLLCTRLAAVIPLCLYYFSEVLGGRSAGASRRLLKGVAAAIVALLVFGLAFLPLLLWDGQMLLFFEFNPFVLQTRQGHITDLLAVVLVAAWLSWWCRGVQRRWLFASGAVLLLVVAVTFVHNMWADGSWNQLFASQYDISYFSMSLPFWVAIVTSKE